jgi:hypothetical protein
LEADYESKKLWFGLGPVGLAPKSHLETKIGLLNQKPFDTKWSKTPL